jgi:hypothetical protein
VATAALFTLAAACSSGGAVSPDGAAGATGTGTGGHGGSGVGGSGVGGSAGLGGARDAGQGTAGSTGSTGTGGTGTPACNDLALLGQAVGQTQKSGAAPAPVGGTIIDGTYVLTEVDLYPPAVVDPSYRDDFTMTLIGGQEAQVDSHGLTYLLTYSTSGTTFSMTSTCGGTFGETSSHPYTATSDGLTWFFDDGNGGIWLDVFARQ